MTVNSKRKEILIVKKTIWTVTAICLAAVLLCAAACFGTVSYIHKENAAAASSPSAAALPKTEAPSLILSTLGSAPGGTLSATEIYALACRQVVGISTTVSGYNMFGQLTDNAVSGTGFIISEDGYILTNNHVVDGAKDVTVKLWDGSEYLARIVGTEGRDSDVAVLKIEASGLTPVTLGNSDEMEVGEDIYVVGNPLGELTYTMTSGIISALDREIATDRNSNVNMFQLDAAVNAGNSGGPVYDAQGRVLGIVTAKYKSAGIEGLGFAIPINDAVAIARELIDHGHVTGRPYLGIVVTNMTEADAQRFNYKAGVYVTDVAEGSCAEKAGMRQGDVILALDGKAVATITELSAAKRAYKAGDSCELTVWRGGEELSLTVVFDEEPAQLEDPNAGQQSGQRQSGRNGGSDFGSWWDSYFGDYFGDYDDGDDAEEGGSYRHYGG